MLNAEQLAKALDDLKGERITKEYMLTRIERTEFYKLGETLTICIITIDNGFTVTGESACVDPANYNKAIGEKIALDNATLKLWPLFGFLLAEKRKIEAQNE